MADFVDFYKLLGITQQATDAQVTEAIKTQRRTWVKRQQAPNKERQREAEDRVRQIDEAQKTLLNAASRKQYDQKLAGYTPPVAPTSGPSYEGSLDWLDRARQAFAVGDSFSAAYAARQATEKDGANHAAWAMRANANVALHNDQDALFEFNEAIRIKSDEPEYHFDLGSFHEQRGNWNAALGSYQAASSLRPDEPMYKVGIAGVYLSNDRADLALPIMEQVHSAHPDIEAFNIYLAWALNDGLSAVLTPLKDGGHVITKAEQIPKAREMLNRAKALKFDDPDLRKNIDGNLKLCTDAEKMKIRIPMLQGALREGLKGMDGGIGMGCGMTAIAVGFVAFVYIGIPLILWNANPALGILGFLAVGFFLYKFAWVPQWKLTDRDTRAKQIVRK